MHLLRRQREGDAAAAGVWLPEELAQDDANREVLLQRLTTTPGTFTFRVKAPTATPTRETATLAR